LSWLISCALAQHSVTATNNFSTRARSALAPSTTRSRPAVSSTRARTHSTAGSHVRPATHPALDFISHTEVRITQSMFAHDRQWEMQNTSLCHHHKCIVIHKSKKVLNHTVAHYRFGVCTWPTLRGARHFNSASYFLYAWFVYIFFCTSSQISNCKLLHWQEFLKSVEIVYCVCLNVRPCLWPAKQVCSIVHHVIKVTELVWHSLIQSLSLLNIVIPHVYLITFSTVRHYLYAAPDLDAGFRISKRSFRTTVGCGWTSSMNVNLGIFETSLANEHKVIATWLRCKQ